MHEPRLLKGPVVARHIRGELTRRFATLMEQHGPVGLRILLPGEDAASEAYTRRILKTVSRMGPRVEIVPLPETISPAQFTNMLAVLNQDPEVHGVIIQTPYPRHISSELVATTLDPAKDVDCITPLRMGELFSGLSTFAPATAAAVIQLVDHFQIPIEGARVAVVGRSNTVGKPLAALLIKRNATVSVLHSATLNLDRETRAAEILIVAMGKPRFITAEYVQNGAVVIDVGTNYASGELVGDVDYPSVARIASAITPVPGGVGPLTNTMLACNLSQLVNPNLRSTN